MSSEVPCLPAKQLGHPVLRSDSLGKGAFVPNDISIGGAWCASFILLIGPNMGGKSTLLRQVCLAVILTQVNYLSFKIYVLPGNHPHSPSLIFFPQIGADVPAESFELSPVDRIFVKMGAKDHIMAG